MAYIAQTLLDKARVFTDTKQDCTEHALSSVYDNLFIMGQIP
jgi:hypothetical protein